MSDSASISNQVVSPERWVPLVPLSVPEICRIFNSLTLTTPASPGMFWHWFISRRYKQALALRNYFLKHGAKPPDSE